MMVKYIITVFLALCFYKGYSQEPYSDTILISAQDLSFKKDTGRSNKYILHFKVGLSPASSLDSVQFSFLDPSDNVIGDFGTYRIARHANGSYYLSDGSNKINVINDHINVCLPLSIKEYNSYKSLQVRYSSTFNVSETFSYIIPKY